MGSLDDIKVLDVSHYISGPTCASILAKRGAEVIKVEPPSGEWSRDMLQKFDPEMEKLFGIRNLNKKGIALNYRKEKGAEILKELASESDVLVENQRPGAMKYYGLGYEELKKVNPRLVYVSISGFGGSGPRKGKVSFDLIAQATSGTLLSVVDKRDRDRPEAYLADITTGIYSAMGAIEALYQREKTGEGQLVDVSMQDAAFSLNSEAIAENSVSNFQEKRDLSRLRHPFYGVYPSKDGKVAICAVTPGQAENLLKVMGKEDKFKEYSNFRDITENFEEVRKLNLEKMKKKKKEFEKIVDDWTSDRTRDEIVEKLQEVNVPSGPVLQPSEVTDDKQLRSRDMVVEVDFKGMDALVHGPVTKLSDSQEAEINSAPELGEHTTEVLSSLGYSKEKIEKFKEEGIC